MKKLFTALLATVVLGVGLGTSVPTASAFPTLSCRDTWNNAHYYGYNYNGPCEYWWQSPNFKRIWTTSGCCYYSVRRIAYGSGYEDLGSVARCNDGTIFGCDPSFGRGSFTWSY